MSERPLAEFLEELEQAGRLVRIGQQRSAELDVARDTRRAAAGVAAPALLFEQVGDSSIAVVTNLLGDVSRICLALGAESVEEASQRICAGGEPGPLGWFDWLRRAGTAAADRFRPKIVRTGACQQVVRLGRDIDLAELPALVCGQTEPTRSITAGVTVCPTADGGGVDFNRFDLRVLDSRRLGLAWHRHHAAAGACDAARRRGDHLPLAVLLGGNPARLLAAEARVAGSADGYRLAGVFENAALELVAGRSAPLNVPADCDVVIEGYVDPSESPRPIGPYVTHGGVYHDAGPLPVMHVTAITHRANPVLPAIVLGRPPGELETIRRAVRRLLLPLLRAAVAELVDLAEPESTAAGQVVVASIRKTYPHQARKVAAALWGFDELMFTKLLVLVDEHVNPHDPAEVWRSVGNHMRPGRDVFFHHGPADPADPTHEPHQAGRFVAIDATVKLPGEHDGAWPRPLESDDQATAGASRAAELLAGVQVGGAG